MKGGVRVLGALILVVSIGCTGDDPDPPSDADTEQAELGVAVDVEADQPDVSDETSRFCDAWWDEVTTLRARWSTTATNDPLASTLLMISAPNDLARLFERLEPAAPDAISGDVQTLVQHFDSTAPTGDAVGDPLGFLVSGVASGLAVSGSFERVDAYLLAECEVPAEFAASGSARTLEACEVLTAIDVDSQSDVDALLAYLAETEATGPGAAIPARLLRNAVLELDPPARFGFEALGRLRFSGDVDLDLEFPRLIDEVRSACANGAIDQSSVDRFLDGIGPRPGEMPSSALYGRCESPSLLAPGSATYDCDGVLEIVELASGVVEPTDLPYPQRLADDGRGGWTLQIEEHPAAGLQEPAWSASVVHVDIVGRSTAAVVVVDSRPGLPGREPVRVVHADPRRIVTVQAASESGDGVSAMVWSTDGALLGEHPVSDARSSTVTLNDLAVLYTGRDSFLLDIESAGVLAEADRFFTDVEGQCPGHDAFRDSGGALRVEWRRPVGSPTTVEELGELPTPVVLGVLDDGYLFQNRGDSFDFVGFDGSVRWSLPTSIAGRAEVRFGWVIVRNQSGEYIVVDPTTGEEADTLAARTAELLRDLSLADITTSLRVEHVDPVEGVVFVREQRQLDSYDLAELCPGR